MAEMSTTSCAVHGVFAVDTTRVLAFAFKQLIIFSAFSVVENKHFSKFLQKLFSPA